MIVTEKTGIRAGSGRVEMFRFALGVRRMDSIRDEFIKGTAGLGPFGGKGVVWTCAEESVMGEGC